MASGIQKLIPLTQETPIQLRPHLASAIGIHEALIVEVIWAECQSKSRFVRAHGGRCYVQLATRQLARVLPCISPAALLRARTRLVDVGILVQARLRGAGRDAAAWFTVDTTALERESPLFKPSPPLVTTDPASPPAQASVENEDAWAMDEPAPTNV